MYEDLRRKIIAFCETNETDCHEEYELEISMFFRKDIKDCITECARFTHGDYEKLSFFIHKVLNILKRQ
jgi:hypothetical protein